MILHDFGEMIRSLPKGEALRIAAVACAHDRSTLKAVVECGKLGAIRAVLVGEAEKIRTILQELDEDPDRYEIIPAEDASKASALAVAQVRDGKADFILKGKVDTSILLKAVVNREEGLYAGRLMSHLAFLQIPNYHKLIVLTDSGMVLEPTLEQMVEIIKNAVDALASMGYNTPKIGVLAAVEKVDPKMRATVLADELVKMNARGEIADCVIAGPVSYDILMSKAIAEKKAYQSEVVGDADIMLVSDMTVGNILGKALTVSAGSKMAGIIVGAKAPIALTSRGSSPEEKINSTLLAAACCRKG